MRIGDINYGGHMGNDRFLLLFQDARIRFLAALGLSERDIGGVGLIMSEAHVRYRAEAFLGDELEVGVRVSGMEGTCFTFEYEATRTADARLIAGGSTKMVAFDYAKRQVSRLPDSFRRALEETLTRLPEQPQPSPQAGGDPPG